MPTNRRKYSFTTQEAGLPSIANARELGEYILPNGRKVRGGLLLRGGALAGASDEDIALFRDRYHLVHNFDFRTKMELETAPDRVIEGADHIWLPAIDELTESLAGRSLPDEVAAALGATLDTAILRRRRHTKSQARLDVGSKAGNVAGAFEVSAIPEWCRASDGRSHCLLQI